MVSISALKRRGELRGLYFDGCVAICWKLAGVRDNSLLWVGVAVRNGEVKCALSIGGWSRNCKGGRSLASSYCLGVNDFRGP